MAHPLYLPTEAAPPGARPLAQQPLLILVGLTGVGKSSLMAELGYPALPDRREVVDRYVLPRYGYSPDQPLDRSQRFALTRRFREEHPGGVAEILARSHTQPAWPLLFDGLRGEAEVRYALEHLPQCRFVLLEAHDLTRLSRLLSRGDAFDQVQLRPEELHALQTLAQGVLSPAELAEALSFGVGAEALAAKLKIVAEERKNYDPDGPRRALQGSSRALFLNTEALSLAEEVAAVRGWLEGLHG